MCNKKTAVFVAAFLLLCSLVQAQVETTVTRKKALLGVTNPQVQGNRILVGDDSNVSVSDVVLLEVKSDYKFQRIKARVGGNRVEPERLSENVYLFAGAGSYVVEVTVFDADKGIDDSEIKFDIGTSPTPPTPPRPTPPEPQPEVVPNDYGVGLLTFQQTPLDPPNLTKFAKVYRDGAGKLFGQGGLASIDKILSDISSSVAGRQCSDQTKCEEWGKWKTNLDEAMKASQAKRGSFSREDWYKALTEVATAMEAKN